MTPLVQHHVLIFDPAFDAPLLKQGGERLTPPLQFVQGTDSSLLSAAHPAPHYAAVVVACSQPGAAELLRAVAAAYSGPIIASGDQADEQEARAVGATTFVLQGPGYWNYLPAVLQGVLLGRSVEALEAFKDQFVAVASHELKNPLAAIRGYAELLLRRLQRSPGDERTAKSLATILQQSLRMQSLLDDLHDLSRFSRDLIELNRSEVEVEPLIRRAVEIQQRLGDETVIEVQVQESSPCCVLGDAERLQQVFSRLLALVAAASPDAVSVQVDIAAGSVTAQGPLLNVQIRGQGSLLATDMHEALANFYSATTSSRITATERLGLHVAAQFVALHGGLLSFEQTADGESRFLVELPCVAA